MAQERTLQRRPRNRESDQKPGPTRASWWKELLHSHLSHRGLDPDERHRVILAVGLRSTEGWPTRFGLMMGLSVVVAVMGLSADSAAVVIGAMLLAPLMTPVMGVSAALAMGLPLQMLRPMAYVASATFGSIAGSFLLGVFLADGPLSSELLSRTSPDVRDLLVALAAGAAGAYAIVRPDVSSSLPGVAVAVALVPPLGTVGLTLEAGRGDLASGAMLLYGANLAAIVLVGVGVFVLTGFVPVRRLAASTSRIVLGAGAAALVTVAFAVPLAVASVSAAESGRERFQVEQAAAGWIQGTGDDLDEVRIDGDVVRIRVTGPNPPPETRELLRAVRQALGPRATLQVRWTQTSEPPADGGADQDARHVLVAVEAAVQEWVDTTGSPDYEVTDVAVTEDKVSVDVASADPPPPVEDLSDRLVAIGLNVEVEVNWTRRTRLVPNAGVDRPPTVDEVTDALEEIVESWARRRPGYEMRDLEYDGERLSVDLLGPGPVDTVDLEAELRKVVGPSSPIDIWLTQRTRLGPGPG